MLYAQSDFRMTTNATPLLVGETDGFLWIRCEGRGAFKVGAALKRCVEEWLEKGRGKVVVLDLEACVGMDSTFMGTMAGLAGKLQKLGGSFQVVAIDEKNRMLLEDLGIDFLLEIEPVEAGWRGREGEIREKLRSLESGVDKSVHSRQVLEAHQDLSRLNDGNREKFGDLLNLLEREIRNEGGEPR